MTTSNSTTGGDTTGKQRLLGTAEVGRMARVTSQTVRADMDRGLITPVQAKHGPRRRKLAFTLREAKEYAAYRRQIGGEQERPLRRVFNHSNRVRIIAMCRRHGTAAAARSCNISEDSMKRNLRNWKKAGYEV